MSQDRVGDDCQYCSGGSRAYCQISRNCNSRPQGHRANACRPGWHGQQPSSADGHAGRPLSRAVMDMGCGQPLTQPAGFAGTCVCPAPGHGICPASLDRHRRSEKGRTEGITYLAFRPNASMERGPSQCCKARCSRTPDFATFCAPGLRPGAGPWSVPNHGSRPRAAVSGPARINVIGYNHHT